MTTTQTATDTRQTVVDQVRTPLLAVIGAGDLAAKAVVDAVGKAKERAETTAGELPGLRTKLDPAELRKLVDEYADAALRFYQKLADQGEDALGKLKARPEVKKAIEQVEAAQDRVGDLAVDARTLAEDTLARVTRKTRSTGEKTARRVQEVAGDIAEAVEEAGDDVAREVRSTTRKAAAKTAPARKPVARKPVAPVTPVTEPVVKPVSE